MSNNEATSFQKSLVTVWFDDGGTENTCPDWFINLPSSAIGIAKLMVVSKEKDIVGPDTAG